MTNLLALFAASILAAAPARQVAVTFDDLPGVSVVGDGLPALEAMTARLLARFPAGVPVVGFVNEGKLAPAPGQAPEPARIALLAQWLAAGVELGNHTYSHPDLHHVTADAFEADVVQGEDVTRRLAAARGRRLRYFRHPYLHTGRDLETKRRVEAFLAARAYTIAPVTHDNAEWIFARAYANAGTRADPAAAQSIAEAYVSYMDAKFDYFERQSRALFGREIPQVLLLHANSLNADHFGSLVRMMEARGYGFVTLGDAIADEAYRSPDTYTGPGGITWLHRWALTRGGKALVLPGEPQTPAFVYREAGVASE
jgi:peptidoglycan/xylan/chitin deacetylase (PgdA/CDA1 family)